MIPSKSRWFVGSSRRSRFGAREMTARMISSLFFQPPESVEASWLKILKFSFAKPRCALEPCGHADFFRGKPPSRSLLQAAPGIGVLGRHSPRAIPAFESDCPNTSFNFAMMRKSVVFPAPSGQSVKYFHLQRW